METAADMPAGRVSRVWISEGTSQPRGLRGRRWVGEVRSGQGMF